MFTPEQQAFLLEVIEEKIKSREESIRMLNSSDKPMILAYRRDELVELYTKQIIELKDIQAIVEENVCILEEEETTI